jgi:hypothetical protein
MSCRNPNTEISVEIGETLETLGPKFQNALNFDLKLVGGALKEAYTPMPKIAPTSKY